MIWFFTRGSAKPSPAGFIQDIRIRGFVEKYHQSRLLGKLEFDERYLWGTPRADG
jgi:hypothetical protein